MHHSHFHQLARIHGRGGPGVPFASDAEHFVSPRNPDPLPAAMAASSDSSGGVTDFGLQLNLSAAASPFSHGLKGVDQYLNYLLANVLVISFMALLLGTLLYRWIQMGNRHMRHLFTMGQERDQRYFMHNHTRLWPWVKRNILYAPFWKVRHNREFTLGQNQITVGTLPSRFHSMLLFVYLVSNLGYCAALNYSVETPAIIAEFRGRTGVLAALNIIPTVLFALRNNPLISLLRVPYDTFNLLHRWCARMMVLESVLHTIAWAVNAYKSGGGQQISLSLSTSLSYRWGMVGTAVFLWVVFASAGPFRHHFYEFFIWSHRVLAILGIIGIYIHLDAANLPMLPYVQLSIAFWAGEIFFRLYRIAYHNIARRKGLTRVTIEWLPAETCRVTYELARPWKWRPGCHVHAYIPSLSWIGSHPFSVAWAENRPRNTPSMEIEMEKLAPVNTGIFSQQQRLSMARVNSRKSVTMTEMANVAEVTHAPEASNITLPGDSKVTSISLIVRAREGMTRQMYDRLVKNDKQSITTWGFMEGPYGGHDSLASYGTVILFAGGVGITHCVSYIYHLLLQYQAGTCSTRKILLIWSVPNTECLEWVRTWMDQILKMEGRREVLRIQLFVTKPRHRGEVVSSTGSVQMFPGRCKPAAIIEKEMPERIGTVGVTVCGPGAFADDVRAACRTKVTEASLDFVEEAFTY